MLMQKSGSGYTMAKSERLSDKEILEIVSREFENFKKLIKGHEKLLWAIGEL